MLASSSARSIYAIDAAKNGSLTWRASPPLDAESTLAWRRVQVVAGTDGKSVVAATAEVSSAGVSFGEVRREIVNTDAPFGRRRRRPRSSTWTHTLEHSSETRRPRASQRPPRARR